MFKIEEFNKIPTGYEMKIRYTLMYGEDGGTFYTKFDSKEAAMKSYISNAMTILDLRIDELRIVTFNRIMPHFENEQLKPYIGKDAEMEANVFKLKTFLEVVYGRRNHIHGFVSEIIKNIDLFNDVVVHHLKWQFDAQHQRRVINQIKTVALLVKEAYEKLHKEQMKELDFVDPETVGNSNWDSVGARIKYRNFKK